MHPKIPSFKEIKIKAVYKIYEFYNTNNLVLLWDRSKTQDVSKTIPNLISYNSSSLENSVKEGAKDINWHQEIESKIALLNYLVGHLNIKLTSNNLQHVEAVISNLGCAFTVITNIKTAQN
ncbi:10907_t:CDS:2, partial [Cetraspora pellucida]